MKVKVSTYLVVPNLSRVKGRLKNASTLNSGAKLFVQEFIPKFIEERQSEFKTAMAAWFLEKVKKGEFELEDEKYITGLSALSESFFDVFAGSSLQALHEKYPELQAPPAESRKDPEVVDLDEEKHHKAASAAKGTDVKPADKKANTAPQEASVTPSEPAPAAPQDEAPTVAEPAPTPQDEAPAPAASQDEEPAPAEVASAPESDGLDDFDN
jgi:hypothetical protein|nr:MAG TPA: hypothetical protein [Caudoviricetes sp.]